MTQREKLDSAVKLRIMYKDALTYLVLGGVVWTPARFVTRIAGMPKESIRIGMIEASEPLLIVHSLDKLEVNVYRPHVVADWLYTSISEFPGLGKFLCSHVDVSGGTVGLTNSPSDSWIRRMNLE